VRLYDNLIAMPKQKSDEIFTASHYTTPYNRESFSWKLMVALPVAG
jgi:hypothetical protein